jgi:hypothetical protein
LAPGAEEAGTGIGFGELTPAAVKTAASKNFFFEKKKQKT